MHYHAKEISFADVAYTGRPAGRGVTARLEPGEAVALVGPNGADKTTLLRCLDTLEPPDAGLLAIGGVDAVADPAEASRRTGFLQDLFGLHDRGGDP